MDIFVIIYFILVYIALWLIYQHKKFNSSKPINKIKIDECAKLIELDKLECNIIHFVNNFTPSQPELLESYSRLTEIQLKEILDKLCRLKLLDNREDGHYLDLDNYFSLINTGLSAWESRILRDFWDEDGSYSFKYEELVQIYTKPASEEFTNALKVVNNCGLISLTNDDSYVINEKELDNILRIQRNLNKYQNSE